MDTLSQHLNVVLLDKAALEHMRTTEMIGRLDQLRATGRYRNICVDYRRMEVIAEMVA